MSNDDAREWVANMASRLGYIEIACANCGKTALGKAKGRFFCSDACECEAVKGAALRLRRFMDAYFTDDNITEEAGNVLGETAWIEGER
jgi:hypothetical protein